MVVAAQQLDIGGEQWFGGFRRKERRSGDAAEEGRSGRRKGGEGVEKTLNQPQDSARTVTSPNIPAHVLIESA